MKNPPNTPRIFIIAGEASGDIIGGKLITEFGNKVKLAGIGGERMKEAGLKSLFSMSDLSIMGFFEIFPKIPLILMRLNQTVKAITKFRPDIVVTIDSPGFNFRIAKKVRKLFGNKIKLVHYVAPTVWAYKPERAEQMAKFYDHLITILPFEKPYFDKVGLPCTYVGHPILEAQLKSLQTKSEIFKKYAIPKDFKLVTLMPGSRSGELRRHLGVFRAVADEIYKKYNHKVKFFVPTLPNLLPKLHLSSIFIISTDEKIKRDLRSVSDLAIVKSGTSSVEMLAYGIPTIVGYKMNFLTYWYLKRQVRVKYASIANIIAEKEVIPEFIQDDFTVNNILDRAMEILKSGSDQAKEFKKILNTLINKSKPSPSKQAAKVIMGLLQ